MTNKSSKARLIHLWWFVAILLIIIAGVTFISVYNTNRIIERSEKNQSQMIETFRQLRAEPQWQLYTDSNGRQYVDSIRINTTEQAYRLETLLISNATRQLTEYSEALVKETESLNNTLILWATVLTLLSIIFTFLGFMELRDRFSAVEEKRVEMDGVIEKAVNQVEYKIQEVYNALSGVQDKRQEMDVVLMNAQNAIARITDKFEDLSVSAIEDIDEKIKEIDALKQDVKENERLSSLNLNMQASLLRPTQEEKLMSFRNLCDSIHKDDIIPDQKKNDLLVEVYYYIGKILDSQRKYKDAIDYYDKAVGLSSDPAILNRRGLALKNIGEYDKCIDDYNKAIELAPDFAEVYNNRGAYYSFLEEYDNAIKDFDKAIELSSNYSIAYYNRGMAFAKQGKHKGAISDFNVALKNDPTLVKVYCVRGLSHKALNMIEEALDDFEKCIELDSENNSGYKTEAQSEINRIKEID